MKSFLIVFLLSGCVAMDKPVVAGPPTVLKVPIRGKCLKKEEIPLVPTFPLDAPELVTGNNIEAKIIQAAGKERLIRREYVDTVNSVLNSCAE